MQRFGLVLLKSFQVSAFLKEVVIVPLVFPCHPCNGIGQNPVGAEVRADVQDFFGIDVLADGYGGVFTGVNNDDVARFCWLTGFKLFLFFFNGAATEVRHDVFGIKDRCSFVGVCSPEYHGIGQACIINIIVEFVHTAFP